MGLYGMRWDYMEWYNVWLVVSTPLKNMSSSIGMMTFPIWWDGKNKIHVPNHQPEWIGFLKRKCENQKTPWSSWENTYGFRWTFSQQNQSIDHKTNRIIPGIGTGTWGETWGYGLAWQFKCKMNWEIVNYKGWYLMGLYGMRWDYMEWYNVWLVVSTPLKNMSSSIGMMTFPIWWDGKNKIHVPNHQPEWIGFPKRKCENQKTPWSSWENTYGFRWTFSQQNQSIDHKTNRIIPGIGTGTWGETWGYGLAWQFKCKMNWEIVNYKGWYLMGLYGMRWDYMEWYNVWLVVSTPLKNMSSSIGMMTFPIWWDGKNKIHVPNHQPEWIGFPKGKCENQKTPWSSWENTYGFRWTFSQQNQSIDHKTNRIIPGIGTGTWGETWGYGLAWQFKCKMNWEIVN